MGNVIDRQVYEHMGDFLADAKTGGPQGLFGRSGDLDDFDTALYKAVHGESQSESLTATLNLVDLAVASVERDLPQTHFRTEYGTEGCDVDVDRFLTGEPECMISYPLTQTSRITKVVSLNASVSYSGSVSQKTIRERGEVVVAFVVACLRMGISVECWADMSCYCSPSVEGRYNPNHQFRVCVKRADEPVDESRLMFVYTNQAMCRQLDAAMWKGSGSGGCGFAWGSHTPADPVQDLPEGTIYMPSLLSAVGYPDAAAALKSLLSQAGIVE